MKSLVKFIERTLVESWRITFEVFNIKIRDGKSKRRKPTGKVFK